MKTASSQVNLAVRNNGMTLDDLKASRQTVQAVLDAATESMFLLDSRGTVLALNQTTAKRLGKSVDELIGRCMFDFLPPNVAQARRARLREVVRSGQAVQFADERQGRLIEQRFFPVLDEHGKVVRVVVYGQDITDGKAAEESVRASENRYRSLFERVPVGLYRTTPDGQILEANPALVHMLGYPNQEALLAIKSTDGYVDPKERLQWQDRINREEALSSFETRWRRRGGGFVWVRESARVIRDDKGQILYYEGAVEDMTNQKRIEEALREASRRLRRAQEEERRHLALELHDSTAQKLAALTMNLGRLEDMIDGNSTAVRRLIADTLPLAKDCMKEVQTISYLLHPELLEELGLPAACRSFVRGFSKRSGVRVKLVLPDDLGRLPADAELALFRVVQEGLSNIHRHSGSKTASIRLTHNPGRVVLKLSDRGRGIPPPMLQDVLQRFAGPGLGLLGMRERLDQLGGRLEIESGVKGTTLRATLPLPIIQS